MNFCLINGISMKFTTFCLLNPRKDLGYFSSNRKGLWGSKSDEVYKVSRRGCDINLSGIIVDQNTKKPIPNAYVRLIAVSYTHLTLPTSDLV